MILKRGEMHRIRFGVISDVMYTYVKIEIIRFIPVYVWKEGCLQSKMAESQKFFPLFTILDKKYPAYFCKTMSFKQMRISAVYMYKVIIFRTSV